MLLMGSFRMWLGGTRVAHSSRLIVEVLTLSFSIFINKVDTHHCWLVINQFLSFLFEILGLTHAPDAIHCDRQRHIMGFTILGLFTLMVTEILLLRRSSQVWSWLEFRKPLFYLCKSFSILGKLMNHPRNGTRKLLQHLVDNLILFIGLLLSCFET